MTMKGFLIVFIAALVGSASIPANGAVKVFETESIILYQSDSVLGERLPGVEDLAGYIKRLQEVCTKFFATTEAPETLHIVVALRPGRQSRVWFVSSTHRPGAKEREPLRLQLEAVTPIEVRHGPVAFAISSRIAGGDGKIDKPDVDPRVPIPQEWQDAAKNHKGHIEVPDGFLDLVWPPVAPVSTQSTTPGPTEFVTQVLEPTGGKILRPKDWFYSEGHRGPTYMWTLSREDISKGQPYTTGVRIQTFVGIKKGTGKSAKEFILAFVAAKKDEAAKVINACAEKDQGLFTRICLETEEGPYHILYSLFWGTENLDVAVVSIAGTTKELWGTYSPIFEKMSAFELIDMKRFEQ